MTPRTLQTPPPHRCEEGGFALLVAVLAILILGGMIVAGTAGGIAREKLGRARSSDPARAREIADAGLADARWRGIRWGSARQGPAVCVG